MRKVFSVLVGFVILAAAAALLWTAHGPVTKEKRTTGGVLYTQAEIAQQGADLTAPGMEPQLTVITDEGFTSTSIVGEAAISDPALREISAQGSLDAAAPPPDVTSEPLAADAPTMTTDVMLNEETGVTVAPLQLITGGAPAPDGVGGAGMVDAFEQRVVEMEWPSAFRVGGPGSVRIKIKMLADGSLQPVAEIASNQVIATPILITDRYDTHTATVTAFLSAPDFEVTVVNPAVQVLERGGETEWRWTLKAGEAKASIIAIGITITWTPKPDAPVAFGPSTSAIWGQTVQVDVNHVFGLITVPQASIAGTVLALVGFLAEIPLIGKILEALWEAVFNRKKKESNA